MGTEKNTRHVQILQQKLKTTKGNHSAGTQYVSLTSITKTQGVEQNKQHLIPTCQSQAQ